MPRTVRNFWVENRADGATPTATGPRSRDGGFRTTIYQRSDNTVTGAVTIDGTASSDGTLTLTIRDAAGDVIHTHKTKR